MDTYKDDNLDELLDYIDPAVMTYQEWCGVGMALKDSGYDCSLWDSWSQRDTARYHSGECEKKWRSFAGSEHPVTAGTIVHMALENGYRPQSAPKESRALSWDDYIGEDYVVTSRKEAQDIPIPEPQTWNPAQELSRYIETLFESDDFVGYVTETWKNKDNKYLPTSGCCDRTAGQLLEALGKCGGDIGAVVGDYAEEAGAWIRFNPLDGKGGKNENVTEYRYALVESDVVDVERQNGILHEMQLPIACLVYSGGKSLHAIVRVDAPNYEEYRKRVDFLYEVCDKNGLKVDRQNRNPSRYPVHVEDTVGVLKDLQAESEMPPRQRGNKKRREKAKETYAAQKADKKAALLNAFHACNMDGAVTVDDMAEYLGISRRTVERRVKEHDELTLEMAISSLLKKENNGTTKIATTVYI